MSPHDARRAPPGPATAGASDALDEKLARVVFHAAPEPHIVLDAGACRACRIDRVCASVCPAGNYRLDASTGAMFVATESCLECGACRIVCTEGAVTWRWPRGGAGVSYIHG